MWKMSKGSKYFPKGSPFLEPQYEHTEQWHWFLTTLNSKLELKSSGSQLLHFFEIVPAAVKTEFTTNATF